MRFGKGQRAQLHKNWHGGSWFYKNLGPPARAIISCAYGVENCSPRLRAKAQEDVAVALSIFARRIGCDKSHAVHALLSGSIDALKRSLKKAHQHFTEDSLRNAWETAFREINVGTFYVDVAELEDKPR